VCAITEQACRAIRAVLEQRGNRASVLRFFIASLQTRILAVHSSSAEEKQRHLLDAFSLMKSAVSLQEQVLTDVLNVLPPHESSWRSVPAARVCVRLRLALADLALLMLDLQSAEQKRKSIARDRKSSVERALEDYMRSSADLSRQEQDWCAVGRSLAQEVLTHLTAVSSLSLDCVETRARSLGMMGRCLRILAQQRDPLYPCTLWTKPDTVNELRNLMQGSPVDIQSSSHALLIIFYKQQMHMCKSAYDQEKSEREQNLEDNEEQLVKMNETEKKQYAGKRAELQAVSLSLQHDLPHLLPRVCADLLECHGQFDPGASGQYLALLQSGVCCAEMSSVLHSICSSVSESQTCALMNLRRTLLSSQGHRPSGALTAVNRELNALSKVVKASVHRSDLLQLLKLLQDFKDLNTETCLKESRRCGQNPAQMLRDCVVILADRTLLEFPLEALSVLQTKGIGSVSRDFSLQVLHTRLQTDEAVESDNKKEAKGGRAVKGRGDQSRGIKAVSL
ncbi:hypothetical protein cypCar_00041481, partial [Cyprinus carpio]